MVRTLLTGEISRHDVAAAARTWPDPTDAVYTDGVGERARKLHQETDYAVILNLPLGVIHLAQGLIGFEHWLMDLVLDPDFSIYFLDALLERWLEVTRRLLAAADDNLDVLFYGEGDSGTRSPSGELSIHLESCPTVRHTTCTPRSVIAFPTWRRVVATC